MVTSDGLPGIGGHRYEGYSLETKYGWLQRGQGADAVTDGADFLAKLAGDFAESERTIRTALGRLGVSWHGVAAEQAAAALGAAADWARGGAVSSAGGSSSIGEYGESFARLRSRVAEPPAPARSSRPGAVLGGPPDAVSPDFGAVSGLRSDYRRDLAEYQRLDRAANDALYAHEAQVRAAVRAFPIPDLPPAVATITVATGTLTGHGPSRHHPGEAPPGVPGSAGGPGQRGPGHGAGPTVDVSAPTQPADAQPGAQSDAQSPATVPAAGGVARAGGAVPDPGVLGGGQGVAPGVDPGGVLPGGVPAGGFAGVAGEPGGRHPDRWPRPGSPGGQGAGGFDDRADRRPGGSGAAQGTYSGGYGRDYGGLRPRGVPGFAGPNGELPGSGGVGGGSAGGGPTSSGPTGSGLGGGGPARPGQWGAGQSGAGQGGTGPGGVDFDPPAAGRGSEAPRGSSGRDERRTRQGSGFLASDEPFAVHCDDVPPVLGLPDSDEHRW